jgi:hypothetical protein
MNSMLAAGDDSIDAGARGGAVGPAVMAAFALAGLILLYAAFRMLRKGRGPHHHSYTLPRH